MSHGVLIDNLGGTGAVAKRLGISQSRVANWRERGVSWQWRSAIAEFAKEAGIDLPEGFLQPESQGGQPEAVPADAEPKKDAAA